MINLGTVNEKQSAVFTVSFIDEDGADVTPSSATYRIDTQAGASVKASTSFTPISSSYDINLTVSDNAIVDTSLTKETHIITVIWVYESVKQGTEEFSYTVKNLQFVT